MATRKKKALATSGSKDIADIERQLQQEREHQKDTLGTSGGSTVSIADNGDIKLPDGTTTEVLACVIVDYAARRTYYETPPQPGNPMPPDCWAMGEPASLVGGGVDSHLDVHARMIPSALAPNPMHGDCNSCPLNAYGTSGTGRGKACNERYFLAICNPEDPEAELWMLNVMVSAKRGWEAYVKTLNVRFSKLPIQVVTHIASDVHGNIRYWTFEAGEANEQLAGHFARRKEAQQMLQQEYQASGAEEKPKAKGRGRGRRAAA